MAVIPCEAVDQSPTVGELGECLGLEWKELPLFQLVLKHQPDPFCFCLMDVCLNAARALIIQSCGDPASVLNITEPQDTDANDEAELTLRFLFQNKTSNFTEFKMSTTTTTTTTTTVTTTPRLVTTTTKTPLRRLEGGKWGLTVSASNQLEVFDTNCLDSIWRELVGYNVVLSSQKYLRSDWNINPSLDADAFYFFQSRPRIRTFEYCTRHTVLTTHLPPSTIHRFN